MQQEQNRQQRPRPVTMRDVAKMANVSQSTVSRVLNRSTSTIPIGESTRLKVLEAVRELGYHPNLHAGSLRGQKTRLIAMMIADIANPFYQAMARAVQDVAHARRYDVLVVNSDHLQQNERLFCESMIRRPVDGIIVVPYHLTEDDLDELIVRTGASVVVLGQHINHPQIDTVGCDDESATYDAIRWLIETKGHRRIGFVGVQPAFPPGKRRYDAYARAMQEAQLPIPPEYIKVGDWQVESGQRAMCELLQLAEPPTAVFACNDHMAIGALLKAQEMGMRVPEEVAIVGFDDIPAASWVRPNLTTIAQYPADIGRQLAKAVFERIDGITAGERRLFDVPCRLIERESA
ncbi:MAG: LacI family DNA-binding transcriptional regulator [Caldilineaceae bacterium]